MVGQLQGRGPAGVRDRDDHVDFEVAEFALDLFRQRHAHAQAGLVDRDAVHDRIRPGEVDIFENARVQGKRVRALAVVQAPVLVDEHRFARLHVSQDLEAERIDGDAFRGHDVFRRVDVLVHADDQRTDAVRIAEGQQAVAGDERHHGIGAAAARVHAGNRGEYGVQVQAADPAVGLQLVRQHVQQHLGIRVCIDVAQILGEQGTLEFVGIDQVAVVAQHDTERRVHVERLRFRRTGGRAGSGIAHVRHADVAQQVSHVARAEHVARQALPLVHVEARAFRGDNAGCILAAVLQHHQAVIEQLINRCIGGNADNSTHASPVEMNMFGHFGGQQGHRLHGQHLQYSGR